MALAHEPPFTIVMDDELVRISRNNPGYQVEREEDGRIIMSPTNTKGGAKSAEAVGQLRDYKKQTGGNVYDSNTGFAVGPGKRVYSPDASWVSSEQIAILAAHNADVGYWAISPTVAIEVRSDSDVSGSTVKKIERYIDRGTSYAVAIDPTTREVVELGTPPEGLALDFDAIIDA